MPTLLPRKVVRRRTLLALYIIAVPVFVALGTILARLSLADDLELKKACETTYWRQRKQAEGDLKRSHYLQLFREGLGDLASVDGRKLLDIGCGPRGSLEWARGAAARVCADPLAHEYHQLGGPSRHSMVYVPAGVEALPFIGETFDIVTSINSFDHVSDPRKGAEEIARVLAPGGRFLLIVRVHPRPTVCEPQALSWAVASLFTEHGLRLVRQKTTSAHGSRSGTGAIFNEEIDSAHSLDGMLLALFEKPAAAAREAAVPADAAVPGGAAAAGAAAAAVDGGAKAAAEAVV